MSEYNNGRFNSLTKKCSSIARTSSLSSPAMISSMPTPRRKRALLCCISYKKQKVELKGTSQDLKKMNELLIEQFNFPKNSILILAEDDRYIPPTKKNMELAFEWLMRDIKPGDSLVFYFSGHGLRQRSSNRDEIDGFDEAICPMDFKTNGMILDDYINKKIVRPLIPGVTLHAIVDSCHSGTIMDLQYVYNLTTGKWNDNGTPYKSTRGGKAICISACEDYQQAADTSAFSQDMNGAMTGAFIRAVRGAFTNNRKITYRELLEIMNAKLNQEDDDGKVVGCLSGGLWRNSRLMKIFQDPMLSSSEEFDVNTEFKL